MSKRILLVLAVLCLAGVSAARIHEPVYTSATADRGNVSIAGRHWLSVMTAWEEGGHVFTHDVTEGCTGLPKSFFYEDHGLGERPVLGQLRDDTYVLAFVRGDSLVVRECGAAQVWSTVHTAYLGAAIEAVGPLDLWCSPYAAHPDEAYLAFWAGTYADGTVFYVHRTALGWKTPVALLNGAPVIFDYFSPQAIDHDGAAGPLPRIYYTDFTTGVLLMSVQMNDAGVWEAPVEAGTIADFGGTFDVTRTEAGYAFLTTGMQPVCPSNTLTFVEWDVATGWSDPLDMTVYFGGYDWPMSPRLACDADDRLHAVWYQLNSAPDMSPHASVLHYFLRDAGVWIDQADEIADHQDAGTKPPVALSLDLNGEATFAWARKDTVQGVPQPSEIWVSFYDYCDLMDAGDAVPRPPRLSAAPNPFNPSTTISVLSERDVELVEIFDARGRRVAALTPKREDGVWRVRWDGREASGAAASSGAYFARARDASGGVAECKLLLAK